MMRFLAANPGAGLYVCIGPPTPSGPTPPAYFELSPAQWTMGVCRFETAGLVHASLRGTAEWTRTTQNLGKQYMQRGRSSQVCPPQNDRGYINAVGLSVEDFAALDDFWRGLGGSPAKFAAATSQINPQALIREDYARFRNLVETSPQSLRADIYQKLPGEFYEADLIGRAYLYDLRLQRAPAGFLITDFRARIPF
ncbi:MAG: hypothetical protein KGO48_18970 [Alphaproteobacteria bacterium]|nr:hypothetical protein [Alphaproteobacteria bacterium]